MVFCSDCKYSFHNFEATFFGFSWSLDCSKIITSTKATPLVLEKKYAKCLKANKYNNCGLYKKLNTNRR